MNHIINQCWLDRLAQGMHEPPHQQIALVRSSPDSETNISYLKLPTFAILSMNADYHAQFVQFCGDHAATEQMLFAFTDAIGFAWNPPDLLFYANQVSFKPKLNHDVAVTVRKLSESDAEAFDLMTQACSEDDLDAGYVELDHTLVYGVFHHDLMVARASAYGFGHSEQIYDLGYITHPDYKQRGFGSLCASALTQAILDRGNIAQIRVQPHLHGSIGIAKTLGYLQMGAWHYDLSA